MFGTAGYERVPFMWGAPGDAGIPRRAGRPGGGIRRDRAGRRSAAGASANDAVAALTAAELAGAALRDGEKRVVGA